jgi:membrane protein implicated in regulation of membrane protease activity
VTANKAEKWKEIRPFLFAPALLISAYLLFMPGFVFLFIGPKSLRDLAFGVFAVAVFLVIFAIWWSIGPTLLLVVGTLFFFYVSNARGWNYLRRSPQERFESWIADFG